MDGWGLVLAGGGGKGSYQMGVWKYLCEQGYDQMFRAFAGTSVGALNAALFIQGDPKRAEDVWLSITQEQILSSKEAEEVKQELEGAQNGDRKALKRFRRAVKLTAFSTAGLAGSRIAGAALAGAGTGVGLAAAVPTVGILGAGALGTPLLTRELKKLAGWVSARLNEGIFPPAVWPSSLRKTLTIPGSRDRPCPAMSPAAPVA